MRLGKPDSVTSHVVSWAALALVNALVVLRSRPMPAAGFRVRALEIFFDTGQHLAAGLLSAAVVLGWQRLSPKRPPYAGHLALFVTATLVGALVLPRDLSSLANSIGGRAPGLALVALVGAAGLLPPATALAGRLVVGWRRWPAAAIALFVAVTNASGLSRNYLGVHLFLAWCAALLLAAAIGSGAPVPPVAQPPRDKPTRAIGALALLIASWALFVRPGARVLVELLTVPGAVFAPFVARIHATLRSRPVAVAPASARPDVPPTEPAMLPPNPVIFLLTIDGLRADLLEGGAHAAELPALHALRDRGVYFTQARAPSPHTAPSIAAIFTGRFYSQLFWGPHPKVNKGAKWFPHEDPSKRFPEVLAEAGMRTVMSSSTENFLGAYGVVGGFTEEVREGWGAAVHAKVAIERLAAAGDRALFFYAHFMDPHEPYVSGGREGPEFERYVKEVAVVDRQIGKIVAAVEQRRLGARAVFIVTGDHGEAFGEHGTRFHGTTVYEELLRVPLIVRVPGVAPRRVDNLVSLVDLGPTILDLAGMTTPSSFMGQSLTPYLRGRDEALERPIVAESGRQMRAMYFPDGMKLIADATTGSIELYDLGRDPGELDNRYDEDDPAARARHDALSIYFDANACRRPGYEPPYRP